MAIEARQRVIEGIKTLVYSGRLDASDLQEIRGALREIIEARARASLYKGLLVEFESRGRTWQGTVESVNQKTVNVKARVVSKAGGVEGRATDWRVAVDLVRPIQTTMAGREDVRF